MSSILTWVGNLFSKREIRTLLLGLDSSGRTCIFNRLISNEFIATIPTSGFVVEPFIYKSYSFSLWDIGSNIGVRRLWHLYYENTQVVIYVVDSTDYDRMTTSTCAAVNNDPLCNVKGLFTEIMKREELMDAIVLIYLNKQDLPNAMTTMEFEEILNYDQLIKDGIITRRRGFHIQPCSAKTGAGLSEGFDWLVDVIGNP
jgi:GTPase SAR1 family protein